jgi:hypothetical protein
MYLEVLCPSRLLYSIYTGREAQCNTSHNYRQYILPTWHQIRFWISKSSAVFVHTAPERAISTSPRVAPLVRRPILLIQSPLRRVKPQTANRSKLSVRPPVCIILNWSPPALASHIAPPPPSLMPLPSLRRARTPLPHRSTTPKPDPCHRADSSDATRSEHRRVSGHRRPDPATAPIRHCRIRSPQQQS